MFLFTSPHQPLVSSEIIRVVDGDSIIVYLNGDPTQVRLACIDAPEIGQYPYGRLAMNTFRGLLPADSTVKITPVREDRYGRTIGHVMPPGDGWVGGGCSGRASESRPCICTYKISFGM